MQHFDEVDDVWESQCHSWQEGVISGVQQRGFQDDLSRAESKKTLLSVNEPQVQHFILWHYIKSVCRGTYLHSGFILNLFPILLSPLWVFQSAANLHHFWQQLLMGIPFSNSWISATILTFGQMQACIFIIIGSNLSYQSSYYWRGSQWQMCHYSGDRYSDRKSDRKWLSI